MVQQQGLKITEELVQRVEVVYVLGLFLLGKHRKKVGVPGVFCVTCHVG